MGHCIVKLKDRYLIWSSIVDAPLTVGMTRAEIEAYVLEEYGRRGVEALPARLARCDATGTSDLRDSSVVDTVWFNRAGAGETCMTIPELIAYYVDQRDPEALLPRGSNNPPKYPKEAKQVPL